MSSPIAFSTPHLAPGAERMVGEVLRSTATSGDGPFTLACNARLAALTDSAAVLLTPSCTAALELAVLALGLAPGDEVIMPSFTFVSTANAVALRGATPVFIDIDPDTLNIDPALAAAAVTPRTRAIMPVHYAGVGCDMPRLMAIAETHGLDIIEDAAQGIGAQQDGRPLGSFGRFAALSFHATKNLGCGEGGALLINTPEDLVHLETLREKGTNRSSFLRGEVDKYTWQAVGSSYLPSELQAACLLAQLDALDAITHQRRRIWDDYHAALKPLESRGVLRRPVIPQNCAHNAHIYHILLDRPEARSAIMAQLRSEGIHTASHYVPLHSAPTGKRVARTHGALPVTDRVAAAMLRLPLHTNMHPDDPARVVAALGRLL